jgi:hypothetical protein
MDQGETERTRDAEKQSKPAEGMAIFVMKAKVAT